MSRRSHSDPTRSFSPCPGLKLGLGVFVTTGVKFLSNSGLEASTSGTDQTLLISPRCEYYLTSSIAGLRLWSSLLTDEWWVSTHLPRPIR